MKMAQIHAMNQKAKKWDLLCDIAAGGVMAFILLCLCGWFNPYF